MPKVTRTFIRNGLSVKPATVDCKIADGLPSFAITGAHDTTVRETRERVRAAILNESFEFPLARISIEISPTTERIGGRSLDLAIAASILLASGQVSEDSVAMHPLIGELSLDGSVRPVHGSITCAKNSTIYFDKSIVVPVANRGEANAIAGSNAIAISRLSEIALTADELRSKHAAPPTPSHQPSYSQGPDLQDLRGHEHAIRALTIAAAGGHNVLFSGPPGCGKTMLARRLPSILPELSLDEQLEITEIQSAIGLLRVDGLATNRPFRAPHHSISRAGMTGSRANVFPGELTISHRGVLFLDELDQFNDGVLDSIPVDRGGHSRAISIDSSLESFPCDFQLVAAVNPCPCGCGNHKCRCSEKEIERFNQRLEGRLFESFDLFVPVVRPTPAEVEDGPITNSCTQRVLVDQARSLQAARYADAQLRVNADLDALDTVSFIEFEPAARERLRELYSSVNSNHSDLGRTIRVARTIADLAGKQRVGEDHVDEALPITIRPIAHRLAEAATT